MRTGFFKSYHWENIFKILSKSRSRFQVGALTYSFFLESLEFQVNQENIHPTLLY